MSRDMTRLFDTLSVTYDQGYTLCYPIPFLSPMTRDMTRLTDIVSVTNGQLYGKVN
jgi:hypothetical protein